MAHTPSFVDDVDGSPADVTVNFAVDGVQYEMHLSKSNRNAFIRDLARFMAAARKTGARGRRCITRKPRPTRGRFASGPGPTASRSPKVSAYPRTSSSGSAPRATEPLTRRYPVGPPARWSR